VNAVTKPSVLIVEDDGLIALSLVQLLQKAGYDVPDPVASGEDAIRAVTANKPDLILMDIGLEGAMDGIEAAQKIRALADIPIVYLTAYTNDLRLKQAKLTEPYGYLVKPAHSRELKATIEMALYKHALDRKLRESEERFRLLLQHVPSVAVQGYGIDGTARYWNDASEHLYGYTAEEALGKNLLDLIVPPEMQDETRKALMDMAETGHPVPARELCLIRKDGSRVPVFSSRAIVKGSGGGTELFSIDVDLTERRRAEDGLKQANRKLTLLSSITRHDISNQLLAMNGFLGLLHEEVPDPGLNEYFTKITTASSRIAAMIRFTREYEQVGVRAPLWQDCRTLVETAAKQAPLGLVMVKNDLPDGEEVFADPLIAKVFYNLMDNAVRYGGKITTIRFSLEEHAGDPVVVCEDDGDGVSPEEKEQIFERGFGRNTGMGLFLAREILSITGISIRETGEQGKGARFELTVPKGMFRASRHPPEK
jgi:PAS domain S-box-containing protein